VSGRWIEVTSDTETPEGRWGHAFRGGDGTLVELPARMSDAAMAGWIEWMREPGRRSHVLVEGMVIVGIAAANPRVHPLTDLLFEAFGVDPREARRWALGPRLWSMRTDAPGPEGVWMDCGLLQMTAVETGMVLSGEHVTIPLGMVPETVVAQLVGRPLRSVISHPALDRVGLDILEVHEIPDGLSLRIVPHEGARPIARPST
jgi:hypothetical protein